MELNDLLKLTPDKIIAAVKGSNVDYEKIDKYIEQYEGTHDILKRPDKLLEDGTPIEVAKLVINLQQKIVNNSVFFLYGGEMRIVLAETASEKPSDQEKAVFDYFVKQWERAKLNTFNRNLARVLLSETRAAELYYPVPETKEGADAKFRYRVKLLARSLGDEIYPFYDSLGDMVAFMRTYKAIGLDEKGAESKIDTVELYTADKTYKYQMVGGSWSTEDSQNTFKKIPIIFYELKVPDWEVVQGLIDKLELRFSKFDDTNDYFSSPAVKVKGKMTNAPEKGEVGKLFLLEGEDSDVEYLTWDQTPEAMKLQMDKLEGFVHTLTDTPNLTLDQIQGMGQMSGFAIRLLFMGARMKSKVNEDVFTAGLERRVSLLKQMQSIFISKQAKTLAGIEIKVEFGDPLPIDDDETITNLISSVQGGIMSQETAIEQHPYIKDATDEIVRIKTADIAEPSDGTTSD